MADLFKEIYRAEPRYNHKYESLIKNLTTFGGGANEEEKYLTGKYFSNAYEIYIYAAIIGMNLEKRVKVDKSNSHRFWNIGNWKNDDLVTYIIMGLFTKANINLYSWEEKDEDTVKKEIKGLIELLQEYANGGLEYINSRLEDDPTDFDDQVFVRMLKEVE